MSAALEPPTFLDVLDAKRQIAPYLPRTPLRRSAAISRLVGTETWIKHENFLPTGAFKVRGGINLVSRLSPQERRAGLIAASSGNHGQSVAYAAQRFGVPAVICVPEHANPLKVEAIRDYGAEAVLDGRTFDEARANAERMAGEHGYRYVHSGDEPLLIAGVGTYALEILEDEPRIDTLIVPIGGGSGAAGVLTVARALNPAIQVIGVQSRQSPAGHLAWEAGEPRTASNDTVVEGLSTGSSFQLPQRILRGLDDFVLVDDREIERATGAMI
ncbi:MAG: threonine/serine dehydratase, partial [Candidatus Dormibacteraeota bacterium]|nr:threonine/serine dehydratase [Candidatus Dormibacteraeota bacterium]